jgi:hypothetical protein
MGSSGTSQGELLGKKTPTYGRARRTFPEDRRHARFPRDLGPGPHQAHMPNIRGPSLRSPRRRDSFPVPASAARVRRLGRCRDRWVHFPHAETRVRGQSRAALARTSLLRGPVGHLVQPPGEPVDARRPTNLRQLGVLGGGASTTSGVTVPEWSHFAAPVPGSQTRRAKGGWTCQRTTRRGAVPDFRSLKHPRAVRIVQDHAQCLPELCDVVCRKNHNAGRPRNDVARNDGDASALRLANACGIAFGTSAGRKPRSIEVRAATVARTMRAPVFEPRLLQLPPESREVAACPRTRLSPCEEDRQPKILSVARERVLDRASVRKFA